MIYDMIKHTIILIYTINIIMLTNQFTRKKNHTADNPSGTMAIKSMNKVV